MLTLSQALLQAQSHGLDRLDAQLLLLHALGKSAQERAWLLAHDTDELPPSAQAVLDAWVQRRAASEPLAYITGHQEFFGLDLAVDARVLVPRPDTETLVEWALDVLQAPTGTAPTVLDLGTGSGAIALAMAAALVAAAGRRRTCRNAADRHAGAPRERRARSTRHTTGNVRCAGRSASAARGRCTTHASAGRGNTTARDRSTTAARDRSTATARDRSPAAAAGCGSTTAPGCASAAGGRATAAARGPGRRCHRKRPIRGRDRAHL